MYQAAGNARHTRGDGVQHEKRRPGYRGYGYKVYRMRKDESYDEKVDFIIVGRYDDHGFGRLRRNQLQQHRCNGRFFCARSFLDSGFFRGSILRCCRGGQPVR